MTVTTTKSVAQNVQPVFVVYDYDVFKTTEGNRNINRLHVERLKKSMSEYYLVSPIIVNENYEIIDGQHRFVAAKELGLPIYFICNHGYGLPEVQRLNQVFRAWSVDDFLEGYANLGKEDYIMVIKFKERHNLTSTKLSIILLDKDRRDDDVVADFKRGTFKIVNEEWASSFLVALEAFQRYFVDYKTTNFVKAFRLLYECPKYNHDLMKKKLEYQSGLFEKRNTIQQYAQLLTEIYNTRLPTNKRIYYLDGTVR